MVQKIQRSTKTGFGEAEDFEAEAKRIYPVKSIAVNQMSDLRDDEVIQLQRSAHVFARQMSWNQHKAEGVKTKFIQTAEAGGDIDFHRISQFKEVILPTECEHPKCNCPSNSCKYWNKPAPIDPLKAREIAEKAWDASYKRLKHLYNTQPRTPEQWAEDEKTAPDKQPYLDTHYPLPSSIQETDTETDHEEPDLENAIK